MVFAIMFALVWLPVRLFYPLKIIGKKNMKKGGGYVLTCTHTSNMDPILLNIYFNKKIRFLAKKELFKNKLSAWFFRKLGAYPVDRDHPDIAAFKYSLSVLKDNKILGIFPEGTRNKNHDDKPIADIKSGAITFASRGGTYILPMVMYDKVRAFRKNYLIIGEPFNIVGEDPKRLTKEEVELNTNRLVEEMEKLRDQVTKMLEGKKKGRKKNDKKQSNKGN